MAILNEVDRKEGLENDVGSLQEVDIVNDPDAGLSEEERKEIVSFDLCHSKRRSATNEFIRRESLSGSSIGILSLG